MISIDLERNSNQDRVGSSAGSLVEQTEREPSLIEVRGRATTLRIRLEEPAQARRLELSDGFMWLLGEFYEAIERFTLQMDETLSFEELAGKGADECASLLVRGNGSFIALVVETCSGEPCLSVVTSLTPPFQLYYGQRIGRVILSSSAHEVSDRLGFGREVNPDRFVEICLARNLIDEETLFKGVLRKRADEVLLLRAGSVEARAVERSQFAFVDASPALFESDPFLLKTGRRLIERAVRIRSENSAPVLLLLSSGLDSRTLMALAGEAGVSRMSALSVGSTLARDETSVAARFAEEQGFPCHCFFEEDADFRGLLEPFLQHCAHPPKYYNHLLFEAALRQAAEGGRTRLWTGDLGTVEGLALPFVESFRLRAQHPWIPSPGLFKRARSLALLVPVRRVESRRWLLSLKEDEALAASLLPERSAKEACSAQSYYVRPPEQWSRDAPQLTPGLAGSIRRNRSGREWADWLWLWDDLVFSGAVISKSRLARLSSGWIEFPFRDPALFAFAAGLMPQLPPALVYGKGWKKKAFSSWLPESRWKVKARLVGDLRLWLQDPRKLGGYLDVLRDRAFRERGIFIPEKVEGLLARRSRLSPFEARMLWTVLTTELLFRLEILSGSSGRREL